MESNTRFAGKEQTRGKCFSSLNFDSGVYTAWSELLPGNQECIIKHAYYCLITCIATSVTLLKPHMVIKVFCTCLRRLCWWACHLFTVSEYPWWDTSVMFLKPCIIRRAHQGGRLPCLLEPTLSVLFSPVLIGQKTAHLFLLLEQSTTSCFCNWWDIPFWLTEWQSGKQVSSKRKHVNLAAKTRTN